jgi:uncharacterized protein YcbK (DUF882 family)
VPVSFARQLLTAALSSQAVQCTGLAVLMMLLANNGLESAIANGDTRTLSLHHIHTDEDITITYKRDGRYDEEALKKLDRFVRDWRKDDEIHMDPRLFDVIWEVSREVGADKPIHVVCGYRSSSTNAMLRRRSSGVAQFSQHMLGKAMDFYIPGTSLEALREAGLRLQRGGVGYYPSSGSPFVHLDVGSVRHWPRMTHDQLARVFPNGRTVHIPSDGHPLPGYALALADIEKRGSSVPSQMSLNAAQSAGVNTAVAHGPRQKSLFATLFHTDDEEDDSAQAATAGSFSLASVNSKPEPVRPALVPAPPARPRTAPSPSLMPVANNDDPSASSVAGSDRWASARLADPPIQPATARAMPRVPMSHHDTTAGLTPWPIRDADNDRVPLHMILGYAAKPQHDGSVASDARSGGTIEQPIRAAAPLRTAALRDIHPVSRRDFVRPTAAGPIIRVKTVVQAASPGMHYDDPWLRAIMLAPRLSGSMTTTPYGEPDFTELRTLMNKPTTSVVMSFTNDPYPDITADSFSGEAVVFLNTYEFSRHTAWLQ